MVGALISFRRRLRFPTGSSGESISSSTRPAGARKRCRRGNAIVSGASRVSQLKFDNGIFSFDISWPGCGCVRVQCAEYIFFKKGKKNSIKPGELKKYGAADSHSVGFKFEIVCSWRISIHILNTKIWEVVLLMNVKYKTNLLILWPPRQFRYVEPVQVQAPLDTYQKFIPTIRIISTPHAQHPTNEIESSLTRLSCLKTWHIG